MTRNSLINSAYRFTRSHRPRLEKGLTFNSKKRIKKNWLSPSRLYNFMTKNTLVDWLNMYEKSSHCFGLKCSKLRVATFSTMFCSPNNINCKLGEIT